jgi:hypothetical protein
LDLLFCSQKKESFLEDLHVVGSLASEDISLRVVNFSSFSTRFLSELWISGFLVLVQGVRYPR